MLSLDRYFGWHFFTNDAGGNPMMFMNLIWAWGHPEVYILVLPAFGIFSEVFSTFSGKPLFGYRSMVAATLFICIVSMMVWLHHFFTMGAGAAVNTAFGISTSVIAVGTGVKIYNWIFTMYGGRVRFSVPMLWSLGFIFTFVIGGMTGVLLAVPPADFLSTIRCSWSPISTTSSSAAWCSRCSPARLLVPQGVRLPAARGLGQGRLLVRLLRLLGDLRAALHPRAEGMTRRLQHVNVANGGRCCYCRLVGVGDPACRRRDLPGDDAPGLDPAARQACATSDRRSLGRPQLEWATPSPPPFFNFAILPNVEGEEAYWGIKLRRSRSSGSAPSRNTSRSRCR
jgi:cytochrome o ubiquinol oxidase subunit 1